MRLEGRLCCTLVDEGELRLVDASPCGIIEVRADLLRDPRSSLRLVEEVAARGRRALLTLRERGEGGGYAGPVGEKVDLLLRGLDAGAWMVDAEYSFSGLGELLSSAPGRVLVSLHLGWTPEPELLYALAGDMLRLGAAVAKLVTRPRSVAENIRLLHLNAWRPGAIIAFGSGPAGMLSRVLAPVYGAPFTYAALGRGAPGQPHYGSVLEAWRLLGLGGQPKPHAERC